MLVRLFRSAILMGASQMVAREKALPGRAAPMPVAQQHYVLRTPMREPFPPGTKKIILANGCFWGSEKGMWRLPPPGGIVSTAVGYAAGYTPNPTYEEVCSGQTGHTEAVQVVYDPAKISLVDILRWFWQSHDPTQLNRQGNDAGTQCAPHRTAACTVPPAARRPRATPRRRAPPRRYRSGAYYFDDEQKALVEASKAAYEAAMGARGFGKIATQIACARDFGPEPFFYAEDYHQQYLAKPGARPYCSAEPRQVELPPFETWVRARARARVSATRCALRADASRADGARRARARPARPPGGRRQPACLRRTRPSCPRRSGRSMRRRRTVSSAPRMSPSCGIERLMAGLSGRTRRGSSRRSAHCAACKFAQRRMETRVCPSACPSGCPSGVRVHTGSRGPMSGCPSVVRGALRERGGAAALHTEDGS